MYKAGLILFISLFSITACALQTPIEPDVLGPSEIFFVQSATGGFLNTTLDPMILELRDLSPNVIWFADRPERQSGAIRVIDFINRWRSYGFGSDAPNAALHAVSTNGAYAATIAITLRNPQYDSVNDSIKYEVTPLDGMNLDGLEGKLAEATLFIDGAVPTISIAGRVTTSDGESLPGVIVTAKSTNITTITNESGDYNLTFKIVSADHEVEFSTTGFSAVIKIVNQSTNNLNIVMTEELQIGSESK
jgi:hypothetical protein